MKKETIKRIRLVYGILLGVISVAAGICLMAACLGIYRSGGEQIYTVQKVAAHFAPISGVVYLWLAFIIGGFILDFTLPRDNKKLKPGKNYAAILDRLMEKRDLEQGAPDLQQAIRKETQRRKTHAVISILLLVICSLIFLVYGANPANFHQSEINSSMVSAMWVLLPCLAVPFGYAVFSAYFTKASLQREIELAKQIPVGEKKQEASAASSFNGIVIARCVLVCLGIALLVYGFFAGGTADVLTKAVNICTECVGLG